MTDHHDLHKDTRELIERILKASEELRQTAAASRRTITESHAVLRSQPEPETPVREDRSPTGG